MTQHIHLSGRCLLLLLYRGHKLTERERCAAATIRQTLLSKNISAQQIKSFTHESINSQNLDFICVSSTEALCNYNILFVVILNQHLYRCFSKFI